MSFALVDAFALALALATAAGLFVLHWPRLIRVRPLSYAGYALLLGAISWAIPYLMSWLSFDPVQAALVAGMYRDLALICVGMCLFTAAWQLHHRA
jgi:hypothetical protein